MKAIKLFLAAFAAFSALIACNPTGTENNQEEEGNYVIYAGTKYDIVQAAGAEMNDVAELDGHKGFRFSFYIGSDACHCFPRIESALKGQQIDLTKEDPAGIYSFDINDNDHVIDVHQYVDVDFTTKEKSLRGNLGGSTVDGTQFKSGTMFVDKQGENIIFKMDAVTLQDKGLKVNLKFKELSEF